MQFQKGNKLWEFRDKHGRNHIYTPERLWEEALEYFVWVEDNNLLEDNVFAFQGVVTHEPIKKMRAMTQMSFCLFADISEETYRNYRKHPDFVGVVTRIDSIIRDQKFVGASAGLLNPNIIARDLGLAENVNQNSNEKHEIVVKSQTDKENIEKLGDMF